MPVSWRSVGAVTMVSGLAVVITAAVTHPRSGGDHGGPMIYPCSGYGVHGTSQTVSTVLRRFGPTAVMVLRRPG